MQHTFNLTTIRLMNIIHGATLRDFKTLGSGMTLGISQHSLSLALPCISDATATPHTPRTHMREFSARSNKSLERIQEEVTGGKLANCACSLLTWNFQCFMEQFISQQWNVKFDMVILTAVFTAALLESNVWKLLLVCWDDNCHWVLKKGPQINRRFCPQLWAPVRIHLKPGRNHPRICSLRGYLLILKHIIPLCCITVDDYRVKLAPPAEGGTDFINASFIQVSGTTTNNTDIKRLDSWDSDHRT